MHDTQILMVVIAQNVTRQTYAPVVAKKSIQKTLHLTKDFMKSPTTATEAAHNLITRDWTEIELKEIRLRKEKLEEDMFNIYNDAFDPEKSWVKDIPKENSICYGMNIEKNPQE